MEGQLEARRYPRVLRRVQAVIIDSIVISVAFIGAAAFISSTELHAYLKIAFVAFFPIFLEPGLVSLTGATVGHHLRGLRVERADSRRNLDFARASGRSVVKFFLGWWSLISILLTKKHQALHDLAVRSVVVLVNPVTAGDAEALPERVVEEEGFIYPPKARRILFIFVYTFGCFLIVSVLSAAFLSWDCLQSDWCSPTEQSIQAVLGFVLFAAFAAIVVLGWRGWLWGCRRFARSWPSSQDGRDG